MNAGLEVSGISAGYLKVPVLHDVALAVAPGNAVGLMGPNGAGKTTLLRLVMGELRGKGAVRLDGRRIEKKASWWRAREGIAHVPEGRHLFTTLTVEENLRVGTFAAPDRSRNLHPAYDLFPKLFDRRHQRAGTLSGGEQQMVALGRALVARPRVILIDELSAGLAPVVSQGLVAALGVVKDQGVALVVVEQAPALIKDLIDHHVVLRRGQVVHSGSAEELDFERLRDLYLGADSARTTTEGTD
ncbi:ABC transporter ATP-binding protein [Streptomyces massasporeus]|uniref:ABC transporter ATP-binding protein n=1 Tax=Streptomyces TaxID=1883 RepID=UPI003452FA73